MVLKPIQSFDFNELVQGNLIDYSAEPDGDLRWVLHLRCHFSKFTALYAIRSKEAEEVAKCVRQWVMHHGPFPIWHSDNGKEFKGLLEHLLIEWDIAIRRGRPRRPQTQGGVERANSIAKKKINALRFASGNHRWSQHLNTVADQINRTVSATTGSSPYMIASGGRQPRLLHPSQSAAHGEVEEVEIDLQEEPQQQQEQEDEDDELPALPQVVARSWRQQTVCDKHHGKRALSISNITL